LYYLGLFITRPTSDIDFADQVLTETCIILHLFLSPVLDTGSIGGMCHSWGKSILIQNWFRIWIN